MIKTERDGGEPSRKAVAEVVKSIQKKPPSSSSSSGKAEATTAALASAVAANRPKAVPSEEDEWEMTSTAALAFLVRPCPLGRANDFGASDPQTGWPC